MEMGLKIVSWTIVPNSLAPTMGYGANQQDHIYQVCFPS